MARVPIVRFVQNSTVNISTLGLRHFVCVSPLFIFAIFSQGLKTKKIYDTKDLIGKPILEIDLNLLGNKKIFNTKELRKNNFTIINF